MVGGGWVKSYLRTRIARLVPSMRRLTHLNLVSFPLLSLFSFVSLFISVSLRLFHLFFSSLCFCVSCSVQCCAVQCSVLCCCMWLCCVCVCACLCVPLCHVSGFEQCVQVKRINAGLGNVLFSTHSQTESGKSPRVSLLNVWGT